MPTSATKRYTGSGLIPFYPAQGPDTIAVRIKPSSTLAEGTVLGEITASPGVYAAYASGASDGTQTPRGILRYAVVTDATGAITNLGDLYTNGDVAMYIQGVFACGDLVGFDATALAGLNGYLLEGSVSTGYMKF